MKSEFEEFIAPYKEHLNTKVKDLMNTDFGDEVPEIRGYDPEITLLEVFIYAYVNSQVMIVTDVITNVGMAMVSYTDPENGIDYQNDYNDKLFRYAVRLSEANSKIINSGILRRGIING